MPLPLDYRGGPGADRLFVTEANRAAVAALDAPSDWPDQAAILIGAEASGKSHLARLALRKAGDALSLVEDVDRGRDETALFHQCNRARNGGAALLMTARTPPAQWDIGLPDLASRLRALPLIEIGAPDDMLIPELLAKALAARGLVPQPEVIAYVAPRLERRYAAIRDAAATLDVAVLSTGRTLTVPLARSTLFQDIRELD
ncbi:chromosomal replication initiator DnaA [Pacificimonas sp. WHA3]|uniref:Chromosomal replication initiator DnaA n=1 Tax=Pacificimonas pallii TaxID=2827236 RepID=A0ABS6SF54_9SPHN|nr:chromosomal replication initiator DnaA [Pacificimonas pallii]MBV7257037.1 chromosomal replication initiator DnaA [Pacificimonas pallii]